MLSYRRCYTYRRLLDGRETGINGECATVSHQPVSFFVSFPQACLHFLSVLNPFHLLRSEATPIKPAPYGVALLSVRMLSLNFMSSIRAVLRRRNAV